MVSLRADSDGNLTEAEIASRRSSNLGSPDVERENTWMAKRLHHPLAVETLLIA
jgi:hypothetical protein